MYELKMQMKVKVKVILTGSSEFTKHRSITMKAELQKNRPDVLVKTLTAKHRRLHTEKGVNSLRISGSFKIVLPFYF